MNVGMSWTLGLAEAEGLFNHSSGYFVVDIGER